jgi:CheY-like chemotaxis protein
MAEPIHVLVVDDDDDVRETLKLVLEAEGFRVSAAANGQQALERLHHPEQPVVLLDLRMPVMDGWEVVDVLRREGRLDSIPIVICTSSPRDAPAGFPIIPKPVRLDRLLAAIERAAPSARA